MHTKTRARTHTHTTYLSKLVFNDGHFKAMVPSEDVVYCHMHYKGNNAVKTMITHPSALAQMKQCKPLAG
jgi:hypothetical protein